ncbi:hypothetical protein BJ912DRAFT_927326 [Pholiota molesta]|nr:hypothetical protein BJ912DRAFT_927326 [Pholiota molesta]
MSWAQYSGEDGSQNCGNLTKSVDVPTSVAGNLLTQSLSSNANFSVIVIRMYTKAPAIVDPLQSTGPPIMGCCRPLLAPHIFVGDCTRTSPSILPMSFNDGTLPKAHESLQRMSLCLSMAGGATCQLDLRHPCFISLSPSSLPHTPAFLPYHASKSSQIFQTLTFLFVAVISRVRTMRASLSKMTANYMDGVWMERLKATISSVGETQAVMCSTSR